MVKTKKKIDYSGLNPFRFWTAVIAMGVAGQICWNIENQWFNTFVYAKISGDVNIVTAMVIVSAIVTTISTFLFGTLSDRKGKRRIFVTLGYIFWGVSTILFGMTEYARNSGVAWLIAISGPMVVIADAIMSFFGSMGFDSGYNAWLNDYTNDTNKGQIGAALAAAPVLGTVLGTVLGGIIVNTGNATVGTDAYDPSKDNYQLLFWCVGGFIILCGIAAFFLMKDNPKTKPNRDGSFFHQFTGAFRFKSLKGQPHIKEMLLACLVSCVFFIPFNFYFVHMGNWLIYDIGFSAGNMGIIEGVGLILAVVMTLPFGSLINKNKLPLVTAISIASNAVGLFLLYFFVKDGTSVDTSTVFSVKNLVLLLSIFLVGTGYVLITQTCMIWVRGLFPESNRGQFEGIRCVFFVLLPMLIGTLIGNLIIKNTPQANPVYDSYGQAVDVPQENIFLFAGIMVLFTFIPLFFAWKLYNKRIKEAVIEEVTPNEPQ